MPNRTALLLAMTFVIAALSSTPALALTSQWLEDGVAITAAKETTGSSESVVLEDMKLGAALLCKGSGNGTVGPGAKDTTTSLTSSCTVLKGCTTIDTVTAVNLPWNTEVVLVGGVFEDRLTGSSGSPGYLIECVAGGVLLDDLCTKAESFGVLTNSEAGVTGQAKENESGKCSLGGEEGLVTGSGTASLTNGLTLAVSEA